LLVFESLSTVEVFFSSLTHSGKKRKKKKSRAGIAWDPKNQVGRINVNPVAVCRNVFGLTAFIWLRRTLPKRTVGGNGMLT